MEMDKIGPKFTELDWNTNNNIIIHIYQFDCKDMLHHVIFIYVSQTNIYIYIFVYNF